MKTLFTLLSLLIMLGSIYASNNAGRQSSKQGDQRILDQMENIFSRLDKSEIPSGILYNKIIWYEDITEYDGSSNVKAADFKSWSQIYYQIYRAHVKKAEMPDIISLRQKLNAVRENNIVPIIVLDYEFHAFKEDAFETGLLKLENKQIIRVDNEQPIYRKKNVFSVAAMASEMWKKSLQFKLDPEFIFTNSGKVQKFEIDFRDGAGYRKVVPGQKINVNYSEPGTKEILVRAFGDEKILQAKFNISIMDLDESIQPDIWWENETAAYPYLEEYAQYDAYVFFGRNHTKLVKPIIFAEGFDFDDELRWPQLYEMLDRENFVSKLRENGYDLIILNWRNPTDYIQRNSLALVTLIERVLELKEGNEPIILGGASMGGLVGRYALALMEQQGKNHQTRLFISFDSPQNGANIPLGVQNWVDFFSDYDATAAFFLDALNSVGARQMLHYHQLSFPEEDELKLELRRNLAALNSYPGSQRLTKLAVSNGSGSGLNGPQLGDDNVPMMPGSKIINWRHRSFLVDVDGDVWALPDQSPERIIFEGRVDILGPDLDANDVYVAGTFPYDNAPGGWRSTQEQIAAVNPRTEILGQRVSLGNIKSDFPRHAFIPTTSALDLTGDDGKPYPVFSDLTSDTALYRHTPFDDIFFANSAVNEEHVDITADNSAFLLNYINFTDTTLLLENYFISSEEPVFRALDSIKTENSFIIENEGDVEFQAGRKIVLKPGFQAQSGSDFYARIGLGHTGDLPRDDRALQNVAKNQQDGSAGLEITATPKDFALLPNYPNPFNPTTTIKIHIADNSPVDLTVYDSNGRKVKVLQRRNYQPGIYNVSWDASDLSSGIYYIRLQAGKKIFTQKSILLK